MLMLHPRENDVRGAGNVGCDGDDTRAVCRTFARGQIARGCYA
jgi:hypothetical protein